MNGFVFHLLFINLSITLSRHSSPVSSSFSNFTQLSVARNVVSFLFPIDLLKSLIDLLKFLIDRVNHPDPTHTIQRTKR